MIIKNVEKKIIITSEQIDLIVKEFEAYRDVVFFGLRKEVEPTSVPKNIYYSSDNITIIFRSDDIKHGINFLKENYEQGIIVGFKNPIFQGLSSFYSDFFYGKKVSLINVIFKYNENDSGFFLNLNKLHDCGIAKFPDVYSEVSCVAFTMYKEDYVSLIRLLDEN